MIDSWNIKTELEAKHFNRTILKLFEEKIIKISTVTVW